MWPFNRKKTLLEQDRREIRRRLSEPRTLYEKQAARRLVERHWADYADAKTYISAVWFEVGASDMTTATRPRPMGRGEEGRDDAAEAVHGA